MRNHRKCGCHLFKANNTFAWAKSRMCCYFYSLFAKIVKITATKVMFNIINRYVIGALAEDVFEKRHAQ